MTETQNCDDFSENSDIDIIDILDPPHQQIVRSFPSFRLK